MIRIAAHIITPAYALSCLCAVRLLHPRQEVDLTLLIHWGAAGSDEVLPEMAACVEAMTCGLANPPRVVRVAEADLDAVMAHQSPEEVALAFRQRFGLGELDEFHYGHATVGCFGQLAASVFPKARRVCFGDAFGLVHWRRVRLAYAGLDVGDLPRLAPDQAGEALSWACALRAQGRGGLRQLLAMREMEPHLAALCLPVDQFGDYFDVAPLAVCPRELALGVLEDCAASAVELAGYIDGLLEALSGRPKFLLLTANFAEADDLPLERDVAMYAAVVRENCPPGSAILLKAHPGETLPRFQALRQALAPDFEVLELSRDFRRYPIEIWSRLVRACGVISLTYPSVTLAGFYGKDIIQPMSEAFIDRWWAPDKRPFRKVALTWNRGPAKNLEHWDGQSPLYAACPLTRAPRAADKTADGTRAEEDKP